MSTQSVPEHIKVTETLVRLYVFLTQFLDRCVDTSAREGFPQEELQAHLSSTRNSLMELVSVNPVVKKKIGAECERILTLSETCLKGTTPNLTELTNERDRLHHKTIALSDLLAVFRAME